MSNKIDSYIENYKLGLKNEKIQEYASDEDSSNKDIENSEKDKEKQENSENDLKKKLEKEKSMKTKRKSRFADAEKIEIINNTDISERLNDVCGIQEIRDEIEELITMIKSPNTYNSVGVKLHKGILLCGKPGTGKTLIARAIAGESGLNFIFITGSDFDDTYVGVGSQRIRELFKKARENKPCIIFIDEIDSLLTGSRRNNTSHSSDRSTINQFLAEMDGFKSLDQVYVIGATNHEDSLDSAAVRPGRFDKKIHVPVPDIDGRQEILKHYIDKINLERSELDSKKIALMTPGFTGADIKNLINLSVIAAVNRKEKKITLNDVSECRDRVLMGIARKNYSVPEKRRFKTAIHEAGHALVCYKDELCRKNLHKLTVVPRGHAEGVVCLYI